ncbi:MAG: hypothetical protein OEN23_00145 [Paracoccaceae bacterium]|nr:hypothetical protein [Paracoccaceae bacterium]
MSWFRKLFCRSRSNAADLETIVQRYGEVLGAGSSVERDTSELPLDKETIKASLLKAIEMTPPGDMREHLKSGYVSLGDFQNLEELRRQGMSIAEVISTEAENLLRELQVKGL